jgi:hypothetical protein
VEAEIIKMACSQGLFAVLFFYVLRYNEKREERLMVCLERLTTDVSEIKSDIEDLKEKVGA